MVATLPFLRRLKKKMQQGDPVQTDHWQGLQQLEPRMLLSGTVMAWGDNSTRVVGEPASATAIAASAVFQPQSKAELQTAVNLWISDKATALSTYGEINTWDVSLITNMQELFRNKASFNDDISDWDVSNVTTMFKMFQSAKSFDQALNDWDVSSVTNMGSMFNGAKSFNQNLSTWNVSKVTKMGQMFANAYTFNGNISNWNVSNVTDMHAMFQNARNFNQDLNDWDVSSVTNMDSMFRSARNFNQDLSGWDVSNVTVFWGGEWQNVYGVKSFQWKPMLHPRNIFN